MEEYDADMWGPAVSGCGAAQAGLWACFDGPSRGIGGRAGKPAKLGCCRSGLVARNHREEGGLRAKSQGREKISFFSFLKPISNQILNAKSNQFEI